MVFSSLKGKCLSYRKPGQTGSVKVSSHNTPTELFQSWSTNITNDSKMILWIQNTRKWFSPVKLSFITGFLRKCFMLMKSLPTLFAVFRLFVWLACLIDTGLGKINWYHKMTLSEKFIWFDFATHPCVPFSENNSHLRNWRIRLNLTMLRKITIKQSSNMSRLGLFWPVTISPW